MSQRAIAETFGTAALVLVGPGSVIATLTLAGKAVPAVTEADLLAISFAFGFIITALVYAIGKVSGCHINPAVTFALAVTKRFPWKEVPIYWGAQYVGAIIGAFAIWGVFGSNAVTFGMGQTHFAADASTTVYMQAALAEALGTGLLLFAILGIVDSKSPSQLAGLVIGGAVVGIILVFGPITGASLNPARAFGPELVQAIAGGTTFWTQYVPVYLIPGLVGAAGASFLYDFLANPRLVERPIIEAVTHEETRTAAAH
ncbi:MAG TPA: MIP/aquaporin family protein [Candidatus Eisenbacteria bacterium]|nr:MIP/aquaporin family protein [Candidatus Eisenbacteria bacterium]